MANGKYILMKNILLRNSTTTVDVQDAKIFRISLNPA